MTFFTDLQCSFCDERYDAGGLRNLCPSCGKPLLARYDLAGAKSQLDRDEIRDRLKKGARIEFLAGVFRIPEDQGFALNDFRNGAETMDDQTLVVLKRSE